jgi:predicted nucleotidyltransferase
LDKIQADIIKFATGMETVKAIGLSGSHARGRADPLSDVDLCIYVSGEIPDPKERKLAYAEMNFTDIIYLDVDFETSRGDGCRRDGIRYDFNWMSVASIKTNLKKLDTEFDGSEYLPGGLRLVKAWHDPDGILSALQTEIPEYSDERAKFRIKKNLDELHVLLYGLGWLEKAAFRNDTYLFLKYKHAALEALFRILYALNKEWLSDEKGLVERIVSFRYTPNHIGNRINSIIMHHHQDKELKSCLLHIKQLIADTVLIAQQRYPNLELPNDWE